MATNSYFRSHSAAVTNEQRWLESSIVEVIKIHGIDIYYIPRESDIDYTAILGEQPDTRLTDAYPIECYLLNFDGYDGDNEFMSKFGLEIRSSTNLIISARSFKQFVGLPTGKPHPTEGDILYIPVLRRLFEIKHSDPDVNYHQLGRSAVAPFYWELRVEQFKYSQENIDTGISDIDLVGVLNSYTIQLALDAGSGSGHYVIGEDVYQGNNYLTASSTGQVKDWNPTDRILSVINVKGTMNAATSVIGTTSGTSYTVSTNADNDDYVSDDISDNGVLDDLGDVLLDTTENNPLG